MLCHRAQQPDKHKLSHSFIYTTQEMVSKVGSVSNCEREKDSWSWLRPLAWLLQCICRLASTPLPWVQWLSGKSVQLVTGRSQVRFPAGSLWIFLSLSPKLIHQQNVVISSWDPGIYMYCMGRYFIVDGEPWAAHFHSFSLLLHKCTLFTSAASWLSLCWLWAHSPRPGLALISTWHSFKFPSLIAIQLA